MAVPQAVGGGEAGPRGARARAIVATQGGGAAGRVIARSQAQAQRQLKSTRTQRRRSGQTVIWQQGRLPRSTPAAEGTGRRCSSAVVAQAPAPCRASTPRAARRRRARRRPRRPDRRRRPQHQQQQQQQQQQPAAAGRTRTELAWVCSTCERECWQIRGESRWCAARGLGAAPTAAPPRAVQSGGVRGRARAANGTAQRAPARARAHARRSLCGHRLKDHAPSGARACGGARCACAAFFFIAAEGAWALRCRCKHKAVEHDARSPHACARCKGACGGFHSPWVCNCDHAWAAHRQVEVQRQVTAGVGGLTQGGPAPRRRPPRPRARRRPSTAAAAPPRAGGAPRRARAQRRGARRGGGGGGGGGGAGGRGVGRRAARAGGRGGRSFRPALIPHPSCQPRYQLRGHRGGELTIWVIQKPAAPYCRSGCLATLPIHTAR